MSRIIKGATVADTPIVLPLKQKLPMEKKRKKTSTPEDEARELLAEANAQAEQIIQAAERQGAAIVDKAKAEAEELKHKAQQQGYQEGMEKAYAEGDEIRRQARQVLEQAEEVRRQTLEAMEQEIISLAVDIAEKFISTQLRLEREIIVETARESIKLVKDRRQITIYVNPQEIDIYLAAKEQLQQMLGEEAKLNIIADAEIKPGGCLVNTEQGIVDATADSRWQSVLKAIYPT
ncbi:FliH/SctL family protein [Desulfofalx alkaliphila]|uniref:FliH/SctL family protein n=1 Tax=Desulfofalx alkaliphila TaxID=105483 RepID=UPI0004E1942F|nr:FliH/SctL family protein [Desulfofalx alkaliphila]